MRIAVDITHPAHFHFFKNAIAHWQQTGDDVLILSRDKDITLQLLDEAGIEHSCLSRARRGLGGLSFELFEHGMRVWKALGRKKIQVVAAIGGTFMVHAAKLRGIPSLVFYDTENATLSNRITYPFATQVFTPRSYRDNIGPKQVRYNGFQESAYLHPNRFVPDPTKLSAESLEPGQPFTFIRLVAWASHHDVGDFGIGNLYKVVERLKPFGRVLISSESPLPENLCSLAIRGAASDVHNVLAFASLIFSESATMVCEAAHLGVPGIFLSTSSRGYTDELEQRYKMVVNFNGKQANQEKAIVCAEEILRNGGKKSFEQRHQQMMAEQIDVTEFVLKVVREITIER